MRTAFFFVLAAAGAVAVSTLACADRADREAPRAAAEAILGGDADVTTHGVVAILITKPGRTPFTWCSGVVVSPHVVVTAAHCVDPDELDPGSTLSIYTGDVFTYGVTKPAPSTLFTIRATHMVDGFSPLTAPTEGKDLGVAVTTDALPVAPLTMNRAPLDGSVVGGTARLVGYGDATDMSPATAGTRREILLPVTKLDANFLVEQGEAGASCEGDSGGATFLTLGGAPVVAGIHAANVGRTSCVGGANYDTRIDLYAASFVDPIVSAAESDAGAPDAAGPSDAVDAGAPAPADAPAGPGSGGSCRAAPGEANARLGLTAVVLAAALGIRLRRRAPRR
jgi:hypothetical protein